MATLASDAAEKSILTFIRDFASEKSQGERRIVSLKKRTEELESELDRAYEEIENAKRRKEKIELEFRGYEVELAIKQASAQALEARISSYQDQISTVRSDLQALKNEEGALRDDFIREMQELNDKLRRSQGFVVSSSLNLIHGGVSSEKEGIKSNDQNPEVVALKEQISSVLSQITTEERACERERSRSTELQQELSDASRKLNLMETITEDMKELKELTRQTSELEMAYAELGQELQRKCICPSCHQFNAEGLEDILQGAEDTSQNILLMPKSVSTF